MGDDVFGVGETETSVARRAPQGLITGDPENQLDRAQRDLMAFDTVRKMAVALTEPRDWVAFPAGDAGDRAWPTRSACNKLATAMKISSGIYEDPSSGKRYARTVERDEQGEYYVIEVNGWVDLPGYRRFDVFGFCTSRHKLFASTGKKDDKGNLIYKPMTEVSLPNVIQAAYTNFQANAIMRMLGIDNMSAADMESQFLGGKKISRVSYASGKAALTEEEKGDDDVRRKKLWAICMAVAGEVSSEATKLLESLTTWKKTEDGVEKTFPGVKDVAKLSGNRLMYRLRDAEERLQKWYEKHPDKKADVEATLAKFAKPADAPKGEGQF
jgi:hypothetical protein